MKIAFIFRTQEQKEGPVHEPVRTRYKKSFFSGDFNVISVDWELLAGPSPYYFLASDNVIPVGFRIGAFVTFLVDNFGCSLDDFHPTGFSLGGQVVGNVGHALNGELPRITGLDPAGRH